MNVFEGARRVAIVVAAIGVLGAGVAVYTDKPYVRLSYEIASVGATPLRIPDCNVYRNAVEFIDRETSSGRGYKVELCFKAYEAADGRMLVPFGIDAGETLLNEQYSSDVTRYTKRVASSYQSSPAEIQEAEELISSARRSNLLKGAGGIALGALIFWLFVWVIGWVVRGFAGIPAGKDQRA